MNLHAAMAAAATCVSVAFALSTLERWLARRSRHELLWTVALAMFAVGCFALWVGATLGWGEWSFKTFYLFGAILNVPFLALGTVYLLGPRPFGDRCTAVVSLLAAFAAGLVVAAPVVGAIDPAVLPQGSKVFAAGPRIAAALASGIGSLVLVGGAVYSAAGFARSWWRARRTSPPVDIDIDPASASASASPASGRAGIGPGRLAVANTLIAVGAFIEGAAGTSNSLFDAMTTFAVLLVVGIVVIFAGFLVTARGAPVRLAEQEWHAPPRRLRSASDAA